MSPSDATRPRFFVDRSLGAAIVPALLREHGFDLETTRERYGEERAQSIPDVEWLADVGAAGLVVLMKDKRIRTRPAERATVQAYGVRCFCVSSGNLTAPRWRRCSPAPASASSRSRWRSRARSSTR